MVYTVTFNPSLDYIISVDHFRTDFVNRTTEEMILPGGKGINVSIVLKNLGVESTALGFLAGFTGREIERLVRNEGVKTQFIDVGGGLSRINVKLRSDEETEINGMGPKITGEGIDALCGILDRMEEGDILVLSGSIPKGMPSTAYRDIMGHLGGRGIEVVVDAENDLLLNVIPLHPFLIKPNNHELSAIFHREIQTKEEVEICAKKLQELGARNVLVSMAGEGAVLAAEDGSVLLAEAPKGKVRNSVGAGDSMVAGFIAGYLKNHDYGEAFLCGLCAGSASAFSDYLVTGDEVESLLAKSASFQFHRKSI